MSNTPLPKKFELETLSQLPKEELVDIIVQQQQVIEQFKAQQSSDSQTSSSPPSTDLLKKSDPKPQPRRQSQANVSQEDNQGMWVRRARGLAE